MIKSSFYLLFFAQVISGQSCPSGYYYSTADSSCKVCSAGSSCPVGGQTSDIVSCASGTYSFAGATSC